MWVSGGGGVGFGYGCECVRGEVGGCGLVGGGGGQVGV